jgi:hypothetical protein
MTSSRAGCSHLLDAPAMPPSPDRFGGRHCAPRHGRSRLQVLVGAVLLAASLAGCAAQESRAKGDEFCTQLEQFRASLAEVRQVDPQTVTVSQARDALDTLQTQLDQLMASVDTSMDQDASNLRTAITELRDTVSAAGASALTTARPLVVDAKDNVMQAAATLRQNVSGRCQS